MVFNVTVAIRIEPDGSMQILIWKALDQHSALVGSGLLLALSQFPRLDDFLEVKVVQVQGIKPLRHAS